MARKRVAGEAGVQYNKKAEVNSGLLATFYTENSTKICFRCRAADLRLSAYTRLTTAFLHRQCPQHTRTPILCMSPVVGTGMQAPEALGAEESAPAAPDPVPVRGGAGAPARRTRGPHRCKARTS